MIQEIYVCVHANTCPFMYIYSIYNYNAKSLSSLAHVAIKCWCQSDVKKVFAARLFLCLPRASFSLSLLVHPYISYLKLPVAIACGQSTISRCTCATCGLWQWQLFFSFGRATTAKRQLRTATTTTGNPSTLCRMKEKSQVRVEGARLEGTLCCKVVKLNFNECLKIRLLKLFWCFFFSWN